MVFSKSHFT